ncbi:MAG: T9SS type A sorting domain-containing protein [Gracilimonas sp.]
MLKKTLCILATGLLFPILTFAQTPVLHDDNLNLSEVVNAPFEAVKISFNPQDSLLYVLTQSGRIHRVDIEAGSMSEVQNNSDHGLQDVQGLDISSNGEIFIVGNNKNEQEATNYAFLKKGTPDSVGNWEWVTIAEMAPYPLSNTDFDHIMNEVVLSPDEKFAYINSGSRTDHGEVQDVDGKYPDLRESPLTAKILKVPTDSINLFLENDQEFLSSHGYIFAEGTRNSFGLAFDGNGELFSADNAGERDDPGEFNWLQEGKHYGFPWRIGGNDTPMQYEGYNPDEDPLLTTDSRAEIFYNDPEYPPRPEVVFVEPILNHGPDGVNYKHAETGEVFNAAEQDTTISSFTAHRSSLGLLFDSDSVLIDPYIGDGFVLAFTGGNDFAFLLQHMDDPGEDLMHLELTKSGGTYEMTSKIIASGFLNPIDSEIIGEKIYVLEFSNSWLNSFSTTKIWEIDFSKTATDIEENESELANNFTLHQNYPNPFNPSTVISYQLSVNSEVSLKVYDILGREVASLVHGRKTAGKHDVTFNARQLSSGIYFYTLTTEGAQPISLTRKMILMK